MTDLKEVSELLISKGKVRGNPVAISLFRDDVPDSYEPIQEPPCTIVHHAMDLGKKVYVDATHHDCMVGAYHTGLVEGSQAVVSGEYLSKPSSFFTYEGAARIKTSAFNLPPGMVKAVGAAPLSQVGEGVDVDWIVVVCNPYNATFIAGCRMTLDGTRPDASFSDSLCVDILSTPWHLNNLMVSSGDFGGRMHNKIKHDQLFVVIPIAYVDVLPRTLINAKMDVKLSRQMIKPPHSEFWQKKGVSRDEEIEAEKDEPDQSQEIQFTMAWDETAKTLLKSVPEGIIEMVVGNAEDYARENNYSQVTRETIKEQMKSIGMDLDEMLGLA